MTFGRLVWVSLLAALLAAIRARLTTASGSATGTAGCRRRPGTGTPGRTCSPPYCLPSYHRHRLRVVVADPLPVAVVLERLRHLDYDSFTAVLLSGANYEIDARNRYGRPVRLFVSAGTGLLRQQIVLPAY